MLDQQPDPVNPAAQPALAAVHEVDAIVVNVETNQVTAKDTLTNDFINKELNISATFYKL